MKAEFYDQPHHGVNTTRAAVTAAAATGATMYSKFHHPNLHPTQQYLIPNHNFHLNLTSDAAEDADSAAVSHAPPPKKPNSPAAGNEMLRRPRGRPLGSKNKPKPPVIITREADPSMSPYILEIADGCDIVDSLTRFTRRRNVGLCVLTASGAVANVTFRQPTTAPPGTVTFHGRFDILSLSAVILRTAADGGACGSGVGGGVFGGEGYNGLFTISLAGPQGQVVGGKAVGAVRAAGTVFVVAASFNDPSFHRLSVDDQHDVGEPVSGGGEGRENENGTSPRMSGGGGRPGPVGMYSLNNPDVLWVS